MFYQVDDETAVEIGTAVIEALLSKDLTTSAGTNIMNHVMLKHA